MTHVHCHRCRLALHVQEPHSSSERMVCPEKGCKRPFWTAGDPGSNTIRCNVAQQNVHLYSALQPEMHRKRVMD